jgi:hypothetical protein
MGERGYHTADQRDIIGKAERTGDEDRAIREANAVIARAQQRGNVDIRVYRRK